MSKNSPFHSERGFTLVELVVAMGITSIILVALVQMFMTGNKLFSRGEEKSQNQMQMRNVVDEITKEMRYAKNLTMIEDSKVEAIPPGTNYPSLDNKYKYIYFKKEDVAYSLISLDYSGGKWVTRELLRDKIDVYENPENKKSYFQLIGESVKFEITDKSIKHKDSREFKLTTSVNLLNAGVKVEGIKIYAPVDPTPQTPPAEPKKYKGIKYKR